MSWKKLLTFPFCRFQIFNNEKNFSNQINSLDFSQILWIFLDFLVFYRCSLIYLKFWDFHYNFKDLVIFENFKNLFRLDLQDVEDFECHKVRRFQKFQEFEINANTLVLWLKTLKVSDIPKNKISEIWWTD